MTGRRLVRAAVSAAAIVLLALVVGSALAATSGVDASRPTPGGYARVKNGESATTVVRLLGRRYTLCTTCAPNTWVYKTGFPDPIAIVVQFSHGMVASHFLIRPQDDV
jgi:hypothetical protein